MDFKSVFPGKKPVIGCIHLLPLPGAPLYKGDVEAILNKALLEASIFKKYGLHGLIVENFRDIPFYPDNLPAETIASMAVITREVKNSFKGPVGVNALRNDAHAALSVAVAANADFIRVNVHTGAKLTDQGIIQGKAFETLRLRKNLGSEILLFADVAVKHAVRLGDLPVEQETTDLVERGMADAVIVTGTGTGKQVPENDLLKVKKSTDKPVIIGSGTTAENMNELFELSDGCIVGSYFKKDGIALNDLDEQRVERFMAGWRGKMDERI